MRSQEGSVRRIVRSGRVKRWDSPRGHRADPIRTVIQNEGLSRWVTFLLRHRQHRQQVKIV